MTPEQQMALHMFQNAAGWPTYVVTQLGPMLPCAFLVEFVWQLGAGPITYKTVVMPTGEFV